MCVYIYIYILGGNIGIVDKKMEATIKIPISLSFRRNSLKGDCVGDYIGGCRGVSRGLP